MKEDEIKFSMPFDYWFSRSENIDLRTPMCNKLSFVNRLSHEEWSELVAYLFKKSKEAQQMWKD